MTTSGSTLPADFEAVVQAHVDGVATDEQVALLEANEGDWVRVLFELLDRAETSLERVQAELEGAERATVVRDFEEECQRIDDVLTELVGPPEEADDTGDDQGDDADDDGDDRADRPVSGTVQLQLAWMPGRLVAWAAGHDVEPERQDALRARLEAAGAGTIDWRKQRPIKLPGGGRADALSAPVESVLGWLASLDSTDEDDGVGPSVTWLGLVSVMAVRLVAQGRMVPRLKRIRRSRKGNDGDKGNTSSFAVRWVPALADDGRMDALADSLPGAAAVLENRPTARAFTDAVLTDLVMAICRHAADRIEVPAPPPEPRTNADIAEAILVRLGGEPFEAPSRAGAEIARRLDQWSRPASMAADFSLLVQLDPPDDLGAWHLAVLAPSPDGGHEPVEVAMVAGKGERRKQVKDQLIRLERLFPELKRPGTERRGQVILSQDEAWRLMTETGDVLAAAGFDVRVPALSKRKPTPGLRLNAEDAQDSVVGANQLANVSWSAVFDDIELTADEISELASQARPLVQSRGRWVELDKADLAEAAAALAERADDTKLTGADMLRHALGLEGTTLRGRVSLAGEGWAADLLEAAGNLPEDPSTTPDGFVGELRHYQADARAWLGFLDEVGLGGCLALDMGLGKTPTVLAHLAASPTGRTDLVIAPPAVVGNWAAEAARFTPDRKVLVHHGPSRATADEMAEVAEGVDLIITTYGTAVRDVDALEDIEWGKVVLDEAQAIKNTSSDTAQQLRRLEARTRLALTGTPIENGLGDLWAIMDFINPGLVGTRAHFIAQLSDGGNGTDAKAESALRALNGILVFRRTKAEPMIAEELPDRIDELDHCAMTPEQIGLYQAVLDDLLRTTQTGEAEEKKGAVLAAITALKQICNHPVNYEDDDEPLEGRSGKLARLEEIVETVFSSGERMLIFTHFASWGEKLARYLSERTGVDIDCYHGGLGRKARDEMIQRFQEGTGAGALVLSLKAGGTGLNLTAASHVVLYDRWWNPAVEDQARDRVWRIGQTNTVICHRLVCSGTVDERVEEVVAGKRQIADMVLPKSSSIGDLDADQLERALGLDSDALLTDDLLDDYDERSAA